MRTLLCRLVALVTQGTGLLGRLGRLALDRLLGLLPVVRRVRAQVETYAAGWLADNDEANAVDDATGRLWVVLGDSTAQAIGAAQRRDGYVGQVQRRLEARDGQPWRVVNLSVSGGRIADVVERQLPVLTAMGSTPDLVTCAVGINDLRRMDAATLGQAFRDLMSRLPRRTLVADLPQGIRRDQAREVNEVLHREAAAHGLVLVKLHAHTGPPWRGKFSADQFHPNECGYRDWADAFSEALGVPAMLGRASR